MPNAQHNEDRPCPDFYGESCNCGCCQEVAQLELQLLEGQGPLEGIARKCQNLKSEKNQTHSLINKRIPPEIFSTIFAYCLPTSKAFEESMQYDGLLDFMPFNLGNICRHWRDIAWSTPVLWRRLFLELEPEPIDPERASLVADLTQEWLGRSGGLSLAIYIRKDDYISHYGEAPHPDDHPVIAILRRYSQRWQDLYLRMWIPFVSQMGIDVAALPLLRTFKLWPTGAYYDTVTWNFQITPQILGLRFGQVDVFPIPTAERFSSFLRYISWDLLTEVQVYSESSNDVVQILKLASQMTRFTMDGFMDDELEAVISYSPIVHPKLQYFNLSGHCSRSSCRLMSRLHFPSLTELHYHVAISPSDLSHFSGSQCCPAAFFERIHNLKSLFLHLPLASESQSRGHITHTLNRCPSITELFLVDTDVRLHPFCPPRPRIHDNAYDPPAPKEILSVLAATYMVDATPESSRFLPSLQKLGYKTYFDAIYPPWGQILDTLGPLSDITNPRRRPLSAIHIDSRSCTPSLTPALKHRILELKKAGIDITLRDNDWQHENLDTGHRGFTSAKQLHDSDTNQLDDVSKQGD